MKVKIPLVLLLLIAGAVGFLLGTDAGRAQRDVILVKLGRGPKGEPDAADASAAGDGSTAGEPDVDEATAAE